MGEMNKKVKIKREKRKTEKNSQFSLCALKILFYFRSERNERTTFVISSSELNS